jgi:hypothetical protein
MDDNEIKLTSKIRDKVSGLERVCSARAEYMGDRSCYEITPPVNDGEVHCVWIDAGQVEQVEG